jgi:cytidylate kinase
MKSLNRQFTKCQAYITSQIKRVEEEGPQLAGTHYAVTISRETGAGAITFGERLAEYLNELMYDSECEWTVFDKNLIHQVLEDHDLPARLARFMPEDSQNPVKEAFGDMFGIHPPNWEILKLTNATIHRLARLGNCILVGRGSNIVTRELPNVLHLRLIGALERRITRCMAYYQITEVQACDLIKKQDRARRRYMLTYFDVDIDDPLNYHMTLNVDLFETQALVKLVGESLVNWKA